MTIDSSVSPPRRRWSSTPAGSTPRAAPRPRPGSRPPCCCSARPAPTSRCTSSAGSPRWPSAGCTPSPAVVSTRRTRRRTWTGPAPTRRPGGTAGCHARRRPGGGVRRRTGGLRGGRRAAGRSARTAVSDTVVGDVSGDDWETARQDLEDVARLRRAARRAAAHPPVRPAAAVEPVDHPGVRAAPLRHVLLRRAAAGGAADPGRVRRGRPHHVGAPGGRAGPRAGR